MVVVRVVRVIGVRHRHQAGRLAGRQIGGHLIGGVHWVDVAHCVMVVVVVVVGGHHLVMMMVMAPVDARDGRGGRDGHGRAGRHHQLGLASRPIFVIGMLANVLRSQPLGLVDEGALLTLWQLFPSRPQAS